jgi:tetratricopeptide (TPR) repeat protein
MGPERRKHKRIQPAKGTAAAWKSAGRSDVSRVKDIGMGGAFLLTRNPAPAGSSVDLLLSCVLGELRARAMVCWSVEGVGMGLKFMQMAAHDRAKLNQLVTQPEAQRTAKSAAAPGSQQKPPTTTPVPVASEFEKALIAVAQVARAGTYYQLLGVSPEAQAGEIKRRYYELAKQFHPDLHMDKPGLMGQLKDITARVALAYQTLRDEASRKAYDEKLASSSALIFGRNKSESQETVEYCALQAKEYIQMGNFVGAVTWLRRCVALNPDNATYHTMLARSLSHVRGYKNEAILHFETAIKLDPWNAEAYFYFGELYERQQLPWRAQPMFAKVLEINPDHIRAKEKLHAAKSGNYNSEISEKQIPAYQKFNEARF